MDCYVELMDGYATARRDGDGEERRRGPWCLAAPVTIRANDDIAVHDPTYPACIGRLRAAPVRCVRWWSL
jgi:hypothetical protein